MSTCRRGWKSSLISGTIFWGDRMTYSVVIVAAGSGTRLQLGYNKVFYKLKDGDTVLDKTVACFENHSMCKQIVIVTQEENFELCPKSKETEIVLCTGGATRSESVMKGIAYVNEKVVFVHDGARPLVTSEELDRLVQGMEVHDACLLGVACKDTIKVVHGGIVEKTLKRSELFQAQTPQAFKTKLLKTCYEKIQDVSQLTDDASCVELMSETHVHLVEGSYNNIKITTAEDIDILNSKLV